ncbi:MAG: prenyltransferase/squalene oxidase repeat-containing protein [Verrucomicrobiia bacterium]
MTIRERMLYKAGLAAGFLGKSAELVAGFVKSNQNPDGGFRGRSNESDLYYTMFGSDSLVALKSKPVYPIGKFISKYVSTESLDFVHLCSLINLLTARLQTEQNTMETGEFEIISINIKQMAEKIEKYRSADGGYNVIEKSFRSSIYGSFLAISVLEETGAPLTNAPSIIDSIRKLESNDGGFANELGMKEGTTTATAAAIILLNKLGCDIQSEKTDWLLKMLHKSGGFLASPSTPIPDLLSTATALHCLSEIGFDMSKIREQCLDYLDSLWSGEGAFYGNWVDEKTDVEYTFYGLLALGSLL